MGGNEEEGGWLELLSESTRKISLKKTNDVSEKFGLMLSDQDVEILLQDRRACLKTEERVEFGEGILEKLIYLFCDSPYIFQENYRETLERLQEIFYLYKNESMDLLTDDELLLYMKEEFDGDCEGSLGYLEDTCLEKFARELRSEGACFLSQDNYTISHGAYDRSRQDENR